MDSKNIREHRRCPEYADIFPTDQVNETDNFGNRTQKGSVPVRWFGHNYPALQPGSQDAMGW